MTESSSGKDDQTPEEPSPKGKSAQTLLDFVMRVYQTCSLQKEESCGCPVIGIVGPTGRTRLLPIDEEACEKWHETLPSVEKKFWAKRIEGLQAE